MLCLRDQPHGLLWIGVYPKRGSCSLVSFDALCVGSLGAEGANIVTRATHAELMYCRLSRQRCGGILDESLSEDFRMHCKIFHWPFKMGLYSGSWIWASQ
jgi:hypothetical protein